MLQVAAFSAVLGFMHIQSAEYGLYGRDVHREVAAALRIELHGWPLDEAAAGSHEVFLVSLWPMNQIMGLSVAWITGIPLFEVEHPGLLTAQIIPLWLLVLDALLVYALFRALSGDVRVAGGAALTIALLDWHIFFHGLFVREALAFPLLLTLLLVLCRMTATSLRRLGVATLIVAALVLSHHLLSVVAAAFSVTLAFSSVKLHGRPAAQRHVQLGVFAMLCVTLFLTYFAYVGTYIVVVLHMGIGALAGAISPFAIAQASESQTLPFSVRWDAFRVNYALRLSKAAVFLAVLGIGYVAFKARRTTRFARAAIATAAIFAMVLALELSGRFPIVVSQGRIVTLFWLFLIAGFVGLISASHKPALARRLMGTVCVLLIASSLLLLPPTLYTDETNHPYSQGDVSMAHGPAEYAAASWAPMRGSAIGDVVAGELFESYGHSDVEVSSQPFKRYSPADIKARDWLIIRAEAFTLAYFGGAGGGSVQFSSYLARLYDSSDFILRAYDAGPIALYRVVP